MFKNYIIFFIFLINCKSANIDKRNYKDSLRCIEVKEAFPLLSEKGKLIGYDTAVIKVYYYKNMSMYQLKYHFDSSSEDILLVSEMRDHYFVYLNGDSVGIDYDKHKKVFERRVSLDSIFRIEWIVQNKLYPMFIENKTHLISARFNRQSGILEELYSFKGINDTSINGTCFLAFTNKLKNINVSLCRELDSIKGMKLFKVRIVGNKRKIRNGITLDKMEPTYDLEEVPVVNRKEIIYYFAKFKDDMLKI